MEEGREETPNTEVGQQPPTCEPGSVLEPTTGWSSGTSGESSQDPTAPSWSGSGDRGDGRAGAVQPAGTGRSGWPGRSEGAAASAAVVRSGRAGHGSRGRCGCGGGGGHRHRVPESRAHDQGRASDARARARGRRVDTDHREERAARGRVDRTRRGRERGAHRGRHVRGPGDRDDHFLLGRGDDEQPRHRGRHDDHRDPLRPDGAARGDPCGRRPIERRGAAQDQLAAFEPPAGHFRGLDPPRGGRRGHRDRERSRALRRDSYCDLGDRVGSRAHRAGWGRHGQHGEPQQPHTDRCRHQLGQLRRPAPRLPRPKWWA